MTATILNFKKALEIRKEAAQRPAPPQGGPALLERFCEPGTRFDLDTIVCFEGSEHFAFGYAADEASARVVFERYGLELDDYSDSYGNIKGASIALHLIANDISTLKILPKHTTPAFREYADAVNNKDAPAAKRLAAAAGILERVAFECSHSSRLLNVNEKTRHRSDARKNTVIAYILGLKDPGGLENSTLEQVQTKLLERTVESHKAAMDRREGIHSEPSVRSNSAIRASHLSASSGAMKLRRLGLWTLTECPRPGGVAVLFSAEDIAKTMDRSRLKNEWRALLGPFVGFDSDYGLLMESDLEFWRLRSAVRSSGIVYPQVEVPTPAKSKPVRSKATTSAASGTAQTIPRPRAKPAVLELLGLPLKTSKRIPRSIWNKGTVRGVLTVGGHEFRMDNAEMLGTIAFICGVATVKAIVPSYETVIVLRAKARVVMAIGRTEVDEKAFLSQFHDAHHIAATSNTQTPGTLKWWTEKRLVPALAHVPAHLRVNVEFAKSTKVS